MKSLNWDSDFIICSPDIAFMFSQSDSTNSYAANIVYKISGWLLLLAYVIPILSIIGISVKSGIGTPLLDVLMYK